MTAFGRLLVAIVIVALLGVGYLLWSRPEVVEELPGTAEGTVVAVDVTGAALDGPVLITVLTEEGERVVAVPSMGLPLCAAYAHIADAFTLAIGDRVSVEGNVDEEGRIVPCEDPTHRLIAYSVMMDATYGYRFEYRKGPDGYATLEDNQSQDPDFVTGLTLMNAREYEELQQATEAREGPPSISLRIYENPERLSAFAWPTRHPESNLQLANREPAEEVVGGANAARYTADGLYPMDIFVVANGEHVYVLTGSYLSGEDPIYSDYLALVNSFEFIPGAGE